MEAISSHYTSMGVQGLACFRIHFIPNCCFGRKLSLYLKKRKNIRKIINETEIKPLQEKLITLEQISSEPIVRQLSKIRKPKLEGISQSLTKITKEFRDLVKTYKVSITDAEWEEVWQELKKYEIREITNNWTGYDTFREKISELRHFFDGKNVGVNKLFKDSGMQGEINQLEINITSIGDEELTNLYHAYNKTLCSIGTIEILPDDISKFQARQSIIIMEYKENMETDLHGILTAINNRIESLGLGR